MNEQQKEWHEAWRLAGLVAYGSTKERRDQALRDLIEFTRRRKGGVILDVVEGPDSTGEESLT